MKKQSQTPYAPGIPRKGVFGEPIRDLTPRQLVDFFIQRHRTRRQKGRAHYDLRLGTPETGLYSWAIPKASLPQPQEKRLAPQTEVHTHAYGPFEGEISSGYGAGTVELADRGKALITKVTPRSISFTLAHSRVPTRYVLVKPKEGANWLLLNRTLQHGPAAIGKKPRFKLIKAENLTDALGQAAEVQEKLDGAQLVYEVGPKGVLESYSVRKRTTGEPIVHTERTGLIGTVLPKEYSGTVLRGEVYGLRGKPGKAIPFQEVSGLLNASLAKSLQAQKEKEISLRHALFDVEKFKGRDVTNLEYEERKQLVDKVLKQLPPERFHLPAAATTPQAMRTMVKEIQEEKNPRTSEGVILRMREGAPGKYKVRPEATVFFAGTFPGSGKRKRTAGGFYYSLTPGGKPAGRVGTGYTDESLEQIVTNQKEYKDMPFRIEHQGKFPSGKYRAPSFKGFETDVVPKFGEAKVERPTICLDFDGPIHRDPGWEGPEVIKGEAVPGIVDAVDRLRTRHRVVVSSARCSDPKGRAAIEKFLQENKIVVDEVCEHKPPAVLYVDDRGIDFSGSWGQTLYRIDNALSAQRRKDVPKSCVMAKIPDVVGDAVIAFNRQIPGAEIYADGEEAENHGLPDEPHITILYGLAAEDPEAVKPTLLDAGPLSFSVGRLRCFRQLAYDVLICDVLSEDAQVLNRRLRADFDSKSSYSEYKPHITVAYLKRGEAEKYVGTGIFDPERIFTADVFTFSNWKYEKTEISVAEKRAAMLKQVPLQVIDVKEKKKGKLLAEVADTDWARRRGLSHREKIGENEGMLFNKCGAFWMKEVSFPLDILFLEKQGMIVDIQTMPVADNCFCLNHFVSRHPAAVYALEVPAGWCQKHAVTGGDYVYVES